MKLSRLVFLLLMVVSVKLAAGLYWWGLQLKAEPAWAQEEKTLPPCPPELFEALKVEQEQLEKKKQEIELREKRLRLLERQVERRLSALLELENSLEEKLQKIKQIENERFRLLVKAYGSMRPSKAAKLIVNMDQEMAVKILSALKSDQVGRILGAMPPEKAASLAEALSGYPPKEF